MTRLRYTRRAEADLDSIAAYTLGRWGLDQAQRYLVRQLQGWSDEDALTEAQQLCTHLAAAVNHDLVGKKTFWVSGDLAEALLHTNLDIPGDVLELPFAACAFVFNDAPTIELVLALIHRHSTTGGARGWPAVPRPITILTNDSRAARAAA